MSESKRIIAIATDLTVIEINNSNNGVSTKNYEIQTHYNSQSCIFEVFDDALNYIKNIIKARPHPVISKNQIKTKVSSS